MHSRARAHTHSPTHACMHAHTPPSHVHTHKLTYTHVHTTHTHTHSHANTPTHTQTHTDTHNMHTCVMCIYTHTQTECVIYIHARHNEFSPFTVTQLDYVKVGLYIYPESDRQCPDSLLTHKLPVLRSMDRCASVNTARLPGLITLVPPTLALPPMFALSLWQPCTCSNVTLVYNEAGYTVAGTTGPG